jgi:hypothetical protein
MEGGITKRSVATGVQVRPAEAGRGDDALDWNAATFVAVQTDSAIGHIVADLTQIPLGNAAIGDTGNGRVIHPASLVVVAGLAQAVAERGVDISRNVIWRHALTRPAEVEHALLITRTRVSERQLLATVPFKAFRVVLATVVAATGLAYGKQPCTNAAEL